MVRASCVFPLLLQPLLPTMIDFCPVGWGARQQKLSWRSGALMIRGRRRNPLMLSRQVESECRCLVSRSQGTLRVGGRPGRESALPLISSAANTTLDQDSLPGAPTFKWEPSNSPYLLSLAGLLSASHPHLPLFCFFFVSPLVCKARGRKMQGVRSA